LENYQDEHMRLLETVSRIAADAISKSLYHAETETHALTDPMTNLPNARSLRIHFENEAARVNRNGSEFHLIMLDLDGFKAVNDTFGHKVGDTLLHEIAKVMRGQLREYDFLARYAGDEFVAIIPETSGEGIQELCQRMERAIQNFYLPVGNGQFARVGASIGAACYPPDGETIDQIIIAADQKMYSVKAARKQQQAVAQMPVNLPETVEMPEETFILELDESHIISSNAVN
jgi:diguanylate cyclase (GGDEF)-like protein